MPYVKIASSRLQINPQRNYIQSQHPIYQSSVNFQNLQSNPRKNNIKNNMLHENIFFIIFYNLIIIQLICTFQYFSRKDVNISIIFYSNKKIIDWFSLKYRLILINIRQAQTIFRFNPRRFLFYLKLQKIHRSLIRPTSLAGYQYWTFYVAFGRRCQEISIQKQISLDNVPRIE